MIGANECQSGYNFTSQNQSPGITTPSKNAVFWGVLLRPLSTVLSLCWGSRAVPAFPCLQSWVQMKSWGMKKMAKLFLSPIKLEITEVFPCTFKGLPVCCPRAWQTTWLLPEGGSRVVPSSPPLEHVGMSPSGLGVHPPLHPLVIAIAWFFLLQWGSAFLPDLHRSLNTHRLSSCSATQKWATDPGTGACGLKWLGPSRDSLYRKKLRRAIQSWVCSKISFIYSCLLGCHLLFLLLKEGSEASREGQVLRKALVGWQEESSVVTNRKI